MKWREIKGDGEERGERDGFDGGRGVGGMRKDEEERKEVRKPERKWKDKQERMK